MVGTYSKDAENALFRQSRWHVPKERKCCQLRDFERVIQVRPESVYLLCTDGFRNAQEPKELLEGLDPLLVERRKELSSLLQTMTETVKGGGERDNITSWPCIAIG